MIAPRALIVSLRDADDPMAEHERTCFAVNARLPVDHVDMHVIQAAELTASTIAMYDGVFFGGSGAYSVLDDLPWMTDALTACLRVIEARVPAWASCFGFQSLAKALGGEVIHDEALTEMGAVQLELTPEGASDSLTRALPSPFWVQQGHHDHVVSLPPGVTRLAHGEMPVEQHLRVDGAPFYASQFHPELDVHAVVARFQFYREHYFDGDAEAFDAILRGLLSGEDTPEVAELLARLVRGEAG